MYMPIIVPNLSNVKNGQGIFNDAPPKIDTLENYTHLTKEEFEKQFKIELGKCGVYSSLKYIEMYFNFDNLSEKGKRQVVEMVEWTQPETLWESIVSFFKK